MVDDAGATVGRIERALAQMWTRQVAWMPGGSSVVHESSTVVMTDCESKALRGPALYLTGPTDLCHVDKALEMAVSVGRSLAVDLTRRGRGHVVNHLENLGFAHIGSRKLMAIEAGQCFQPPRSTRLAETSDLDSVRLVQERAFGMSTADAASLCSPEMFADSKTEVVVALSDKALVATATAHHDGGMVGIFGVACEPKAEGHGHGSVVTLAAAQRGFDRGADVCWLQADDAVAAFYERLGFVPIDVCDVWVSAYV